MTLKTQRNVIGSVPGTQAKNLFINPSLRYWQALGPSPAAVSASTAESLCADGWFVNPGDTGGLYDYSVSRYALSDAERTNIGDESIDYGINLNVTSIANNTDRGPGLVHKIENVRKSGNKTFTVSFWAESPTNSILKVRGIQHFGVSGSTLVETTEQDAVLTSGTFRYFVLKFEFDSLSGKTVDATDLQNWFGISFRLAPNTTGQFRITTPQIEEGPSVSDFFLPDSASELVTCQRYFEKTYDPEVVPGTITREGEIIVKESGTDIWNSLYFDFEVLKLYNPAETDNLWAWYNPSTGAKNSIAHVGVANYNIDTNYSEGESLRRSFMVKLTASLTLEDRIMAGHFVADSTIKTQDY